MYSCGPLHMGIQRQDDLPEPTQNIYLLIQDVALKTYQEWWMIDKGGRRGLGVSVLMAGHDDDNDERSESLTDLYKWLIYCSEGCSINWKQ